MDIYERPGDLGTSLYFSEGKRNLNIYIKVKIELYLSSCNFSERKKEKIIFLFNFQSIKQK